MQETKFDVWSPVDNKNMLSRLFWIVGSLVSLLLLIVSLCIENAILSILDILLPMGIILYGLLKRKKFPIYYYTTCLSGLYPIIWLVIITTCDFSEETPQKNSHFVAYIIMILVGLTAILLLNSLFIRKRENQNNKLTTKRASILIFDKIILFLVLVSILGSLFLNLNVTCDKPYKTEWVYLQDIAYLRHGDAIVSYSKQNSDQQYKINAHDDKLFCTSDWREDWLYIDETNNEVFQIEYGNGALGIPWRRIVENK